MRNSSDWKKAGAPALELGGNLTASVTPESPRSEMRTPMRWPIRVRGPCMAFYDTHTVSASQTEAGGDRIVLSPPPRGRIRGSYVVGFLNRK